MKVRVNTNYIYSPNVWDAFRPCQHNDLKAGQLVKVINLPSAPRANTMGQCYVADPNTGEFICMVSTGSLMPVSQYVAILKAQVAKMEAV
jgi:hypothetical protein